MRSIFATAWQRASSLLLLAVLAFSSALALAADAAIAVTVDRSSETFHVAATIHTTAPLPTVWDVMTDFEHMTTILSNLKSSAVLKRDGHNLVVRQEGVARYGILSFNFESEREVHLAPPATHIHPANFRHGEKYGKRSGVRAGRGRRHHVLHRRHSR